MKLLFAPFKLIAGRISGVASRRVSARLWGVVDRRQGPPEPEDRRATWPKLAAALMIEGAVMRTVSGLVDHAARRWFARLTGRWPGNDPRAEEPPAEAPGKSEPKS